MLTDEGLERLLVKVEDKSPWYPVCPDCWLDGGCREHSRPDGGTVRDLGDASVVEVVRALAEAFEDRTR